MARVDTNEYYLSRAQQERRMREAANSPNVAAIHRELEIRYVALVAGCSRSSQHHAMVYDEPAPAPTPALLRQLMPAA